MQKLPRRLKIGILGCGPIAQFAHFDACKKAKNVELHAICDAAGDLLERMRLIHEPAAAYSRFGDMLADPTVEAVIVAVADPFHVPLCLEALAAGKHVLVEKPLGVTIEECEVLRRRLAETQLVLQVGNNRRFDPGMAFAQQFVRREMGPLMGLKAWYYDSTYRYTMTDNLQPVPFKSRQSRRPTEDPRAYRLRYYLMTHGSHLVDTARTFGGEISAVRARVLERFGAYCWFVSLELANGALGHLDLTIAVRGDFEEGFQIYGEHGSAKGLVHLPWYHKTSIVECFSTKDRQFRRPLGEDAHTYKLQLESFADTILNGAPQQGANIDDGVAAMRALLAISRSAATGETVRLADV